MNEIKNLLRERDILLFLLCFRFGSSESPEDKERIVRSSGGLLCLCAGRFMGNRWITTTV